MAVNKAKAVLPIPPLFVPQSIIFIKYRISLP
jgi:hypothetical protein